jgi:hypothetical protein
MTKVIYDGPSDFQEFSAADFKKADVEGKKVKFAQGEPTEVPDEVAQALLSEEGIFGDFKFSASEEDDEEIVDDEGEGEGDPVADAQLPKSGKKAKTKGTATPGGDTGGPTSTGAGSSTAGATP